MSLKHTVLKLGVAGLRAIYAPLKLQKTKNRIVILSRQSKSETMDIRMLREYIEQNHPETEIKVLVRFIEPGIGSKIAYGFHVLSQMKEIAASRAVVIDGYCIAASVLDHKPETTVIQMWHSMAAIKKFGRQTVGKEGGSSAEIADIMCMHRNYDFVISPGEETGRLFCRGFGCSEDRLVNLCLPRIDYISDAGTGDLPELPAGMKKSADESRDRELLLYAPTFRKNEGLRIGELIEAVDFDKFTLVIKPHPLDVEDISREIRECGHEEDIIVDDTYGTFAWLKVCDRVITDYSAVAVESLVTGKPLYFYVYDIDEYEEKVGLNINPLEEVPGISAADGAALRKLLREPYNYEEQKGFREKYLTAGTEDCTKQLAEFITGVANGNIKKTR